jgi:hypothetical protein
MKTKTLAALTLILGIALSTSAFAQGRHDEKPHGTGKPAATQESKVTRTATGGRHDEGITTHGAKKTSAKTDSPKAGDDKGGK